MIKVNGHTWGNIEELLATPDLYAGSELATAVLREAQEFEYDIFKEDENGNTIQTRQATNAEYEKCLWTVLEQNPVRFKVDK